MQWLKQSTAITLKIGPFIDETDGKTAETGLTIAQADVRLSKNGANIAQKNESTSCTHDELGIYGCPIDTTDTATLGRLQLWVHESGALPVWHEFMVVPANVWDSMFGSDMLKVDVHAIDDDETAANNLESYCDGTTPIPANATQISADATAADNLELITEIANITSLTVDAAGHLEANVVEIEGADPTDTIRDSVVDDATRIDASALNTLSGHDPGSTLCADGTPLTAAETESEVNDALVALKLDHLVAVADSDDPVNDSIVAKLAASDGDWSGFDKATDSLEAIRDRGDAAWVTGGGGAISDILNVQPLIPHEIDLANTATYRLGLMLFNALDDLPSTAEITPGTISIDRKAIGATSWSSIVTDAACSESAGLVYYDEVFDSGTGYAEGDSIRITLKSQKITVAANDYEVTDATGRIFYTSIRQTMRGTDSALLAASAPTNFGDLSITASTGRVDVASVEGSDATDQIRDAVVDDATRIDASALNTLSGKAPSKAYLAGSTDADGGIDSTEAAVIQSECNDALVAQKLDHLVAVADSDDPVNDSIVAKLAASDGDWSGFDKTTDSLEAIRDRGDAEWTTGAAAGLTVDDIWDEEMDVNAPAACNTAREYMNVLISGIAGETAGTGDWSARDLGDTKTRLQGTLSAAGARSSIDTLDGT